MNTSNVNSVAAAITDAPVAETVPSPAAVRTMANAALPEGTPAEEAQAIAADPATDPAPEAKPFKAKYALCIPAWQRFVPRAQWTPTLRDRNGPKDFCEKDLNYVQLLPYITLVDEDGFIFVYTRGNAGDEKALHDMRSCGVGGHMDNPLVVEEGESVAEALDNLIIAEAIREVEEEVGYKVPEAQMRQALADSFPIYYPARPVDAVHLGLSITIKVPNRQCLSKLEDGTILQPTWMDRAYANLQMHVESMVKPESLAWVFETWSKVHLSVTQSPDTERNYRQGVKSKAWRFRQQRTMVDLFSQAVAQESATSPKLKIVVNNGTHLEVSFDQGASWMRTEPPMSALVDQIHVGTLPLEGHPGETQKAYTFFSTLAELAITTVDFKHWDTIEFKPEEPVTSTAEAAEAVKAA